MRLLRLLLLVPLLLAAGCASASASTVPPQATQPTLVLSSPTSQITPISLPTETPIPTTAAAPSATLEPTATQTPTPAPCSSDLCTYSTAFIFIPPISPPGNDTVDASYRFGTTQGGTRDPHHGVEFLNSIGTPVMAAAAGEVVVAGDDRTVFQGPYSYFYGNVVVLRHAAPPGLPDMPETIYSLYGHLSEILVAVGDQVQQGQAIGKVGMSGIATGSHLHFEVRVGENDYKHSSNPELWLEPLPDRSGSSQGAFAGRVLDQWGILLEVDSFTLELLNDSGQPVGFSKYFRTYEEKILRGQSPFNDTFAVGNLPAGRYRLSFAKYGYQQFEVDILPGQLTVATFVVGQ